MPYFRCDAAASIRAAPGAGPGIASSSGSAAPVAPSSVSSVRAGVLSPSPTRVSSANAGSAARRSSVYEYIRNSPGIAAPPSGGGGSGGGGNANIDLSDYVTYKVYDPKMSGIDTEINSIWEHPTLGINAIWEALREQGDTNVTREEIEEIVRELLSDPDIVAEFRGEQGPQGPQGPEGPQGPQGEPGEPGADAQLPTCPSDGEYALVHKSTGEIQCVLIVYPGGGGSI